MEIYWQNKDKNQVDVLVERTMKALIANNQAAILSGLLCRTDVLLRRE